MKQNILALVGVILLASGVVYAQVADIPAEPDPVIEKIYTPTDEKIRAEMQNIIASSTLPSLEAIKIAYEKSNNDEIILLLKDILSHIRHIDRRLYDI